MTNFGLVRTINCISNLEIAVKDRDRKNVKYLLSLTPEQLYHWYQQVDEQDLIYASLIIDQYAAELEDDLFTEQLESAIAAMPILVEAQAVIAMIRG